MRFCSYCGQPLDPVTQECPVCGGYKTNDFSEQFSASLKNTLRSPLMLIFCVILTASVLVSLIDSKYFLIECINLIIPIALWCTYFAACSSKRAMGLGGIRMISICITIIRVLFWILLAILFVFSIIIIAVPSLLSEYILYFSYMLGDAAAFVDFGASIILVIGILLLITIIILALINIFFFGCIAKSIKSILESFKYNENRLRKFTGVKAWLIITVIIYGIFAIYALNFSGILYTTTLLLGAILAGKVGKTDIM